MRAEGLSACDEVPEGVKPLKILILNLMPEKIGAGMDLFRALETNSTRPVQVFLVKMSNLFYKSTPQQYMDTYYQDVADIMEQGGEYDGLIVNGAPFGRFEYEEIIYWRQLCVFFRWVDKHVYSSLYICWGAFARIFYNWGVRFVRIGFQWSGIYPHRLLDKTTPYANNDKDAILMPVSRPCYISHYELSTFPDLKIIAESPITGPALFVSEPRRQVFAISHPEYSADRLDFEYHRDLENGSHPMIPYNYYENDDPLRPYSYSWKESRDYIFKGWLETYFNA